MALELQVAAATALVTSEPRAKQSYEGQGDQRRVVGRVSDAEGRPLSAVNAIVIADHVGVMEAQVMLPDLQMTGMAPGAVIRLEGEINIRLSGREFGVIAATVTGERQSPIGNYIEWATAAANGKAKPATEARPS